MEYVVKPMSRNEIRFIARIVRKMQRSETTLYFDIIDFLEHTLPVLLPNFTLSIGTRLEMGDCHGLTFPDRNEIRFREDVYDGVIAGNGRDRLTAAHELFHLLIHSNDSVAFARTGTDNMPIYMNPEWQADAFGGELLVPSDLATDLSVTEIAEKCGVSLKAAAYQYKIMHRM